MAATPPPTSATSPTPPRQPSIVASTSRGLACASCQQRKVRCDRSFPCNSCNRRGERCVPGVAVLPKQRRRRFAERELLDRLRSYETLLRANNISFDPMHKEQPERKPLEPLNLLRAASRDAASPTSESSDRAMPGQDVKPSFQARSYWPLVQEKTSSNSDESDDSDGDLPLERQIRGIWADVHSKNGYILPFGRPLVPVDLSQRHPDQVTIFRLWQIYLDNVNPLLKVTHTPTLQPRIINAGSNVASINPALNALMFSIYCIAISSLTDVECSEMFSLPKLTVLTDYQLYCQQALSNCGILCTTSRESLTALYLYLLSIATNMDPQSVSSLMGIAIRIARRMKLQTESSYNKLPALEAELRRRLWWSMMLFDSRMGEMAGSITSMVPTWDCRVPLNVNDFELQGDMQASPKAQSTMSEAIFTTVRSELGDMIRNSSYYLDFVNPALKLIGVPNQRVKAIENSEVAAQAKEMETNYLTHCNQENSVHFMALWFTRQHIAKAYLMEHYSKIASNPSLQTDAQRDTAMQQALLMLEHDTILMRSPLVKGYHWYLWFYLPLPAYFQILLDLKKRPLSGFADRAWQVMGDHYKARGLFERRDHLRMFKMFSKLCLSAWQACEEAATREMRFLQRPRFIVAIQQQAEEIFKELDAPRMANDMAKMNFDTTWAIGQDPLPPPGPFLNSDFIDSNVADLNGPSLLGIDLESFNWDDMDWNPLQSQAWG